MQPSPPTTADLREIFRVLMRRKLLLMLPWALAALAGVALAFVLKPIYFSTVTLYLERPQSSGGPLTNMVGASSPEQKADIMREQVESSPFLKSVINATGIKNDPSVRSWALKEAGKYRGMSPDERIEAFLVDYLRDAVSIKRGKGDVFQITVGDLKPARARLLADGVANQFVISSKAAQMEAVGAAQEFSLEQQAVYKKKLEESEGRLESFRRQGLSSDLTGSDVNQTNLSKARSLLDQAINDVDEGKARANGFLQELSGKVRPNDPQALSNSTTSGLIGQLCGLERNLAASMLVTDIGGDNGASARSASARKMSELEVELNQRAALAFPNLSQDVRDLLVQYRLAQADLQAKEARRSYLSSQVGSYQQHVVMTPDRDIELQRLTAEVENNRALYNAFLQQSAAAAISEAFANAKVSGRFEVLEPATMPIKAGKPNRPMLILLSLVIGGVIGVGSVLIAEQHDQSMKNAEEVENLLGLPVLGAIPRVEELQRSRRRRNAATATATGIAAPRDPGLLHRLKVESPLGLEFRRIYLKLAKSSGRTLPSTLLITSSTRGEGKTTTSACLGITFARELGEKLLLVDFDLRSPALHRALGLPSSSWGLAQMLHTQKFDERFVRTTVLPNLDFLPAGRSDRPAAELLDTDAVEWFLREARERYPLVLIDSAPTLAVPDPLVLGRVVEGVLYVIKAGTTIRKAAEYGVRVQREAKDNVLGVLMNDAGEILPHYYGYHDAYGYASEAAGAES